MEIIVAVDSNWGIGRGTQLLLPIREDLQRFKALTTGHTVVYGRKTLESFPGQKPLPKRKNIILSRQMEEGEDRVIARSYDELFKLLNGEDEVKLIGGATVYADLLEYCDAVELTVIEHAFDAVDHYFPNLEKRANWQLVSESEAILDEASGIYFRYRRYENTAVRHYTCEE